MRFAVLVSGHGSNLFALLEAEARGALAPAEIAVVLSNRPDAPALDRAQKFAKPTVIVDHRDYAGRDDFEAAMLAALDPYRVEAVVLAGFMRILETRFVSAFPNRIINTHPALLPSFPGLDAPAQAIEYGVKQSGCSVHFVDLGVDTGPIIAQVAVPVLDDDDAGSLHERIKAREHELLPEVVQLLAAGRLQCVGRRVCHLPAPHVPAHNANENAKP
ncbi:MAG: phosphoribosylglycinamide formyltransferase [Proteobacteria bacterium]|nr:phosphoribosylglycinamide formyltransferase [Pseudomonadota bacterium]